MGCEFWQLRLRCRPIYADAKHICHPRANQGVWNEKEECGTEMEKLGNMIRRGRNYARSFFCAERTARRISA